MLGPIGWSMCEINRTNLGNLPSVSVPKNSQMKWAFLWKHNLSRSHSSLPVLLPLLLPTTTLHLPYWFILFWVLPSPIAQSYLGLMVWRTCRKDNGVVNVCRWCWMIGRWRRSILFGARSMASRIADKHLSAKQKKQKQKQYLNMNKGTSGRARSSAEGQNLVHAG